MTQCQSIHALLHTILRLAAEAHPYPGRLRPGYGSYLSSIARAHHRNGRQSLGSVMQRTAAVIQMLEPEAVSLIFFIMESIELINRDLMEAVKILPPFPAAAKIIIQIRIRTLLAELWRYIERAHCQHINTVAGDGAERRSDRDGRINPCVILGTRLDAKL